MAFDRRAMLAGAAALALAGPVQAVRPRPLRVALLGQSLIQQDLCAIGWPAQAAIRSRLGRADVVFTDLETAIAAPGAGAPTRQGEVLHAAPPAVIDCLQSLGVNLVTTANNHAWDLGSDGILAAIAALDARGIAHAGTGRDLATAAAAAVRRTPHGDVALVAVAAGAIREGAGATPNRPGVAELRRTPAGDLDERDVARTLAAIAAARADGATVIVCLHNHYWEPDQATTPAWQRAFARRSVDAGAAAFVAHGTPLMQGHELYRGAPLFHGLGNFIFQTRKADDAYGPPTWRSMIVEAEFLGGRFAGATLVPLQLDSAKPPGAEFTRGTPAIRGSATRMSAR